MTVFFTGDTHFGDPRVLRLDRRPFATVAAHDEALIAWWNETVGADDEVWHLGDFARGGQARIETLLGRLNGRKHLIVGNNDPLATIAAAGWASIQHYAEPSVDGVPLALCHYPFRTWNGMGRGRKNIHGHSHGKLKKMTGQYDAGVDAWNYRPVTLAEMIGSRGRVRAAASPRRIAAE